MNCMVTKPLKKGEKIKVHNEEYEVVSCTRVKDTNFYNVQYAVPVEEKDE